MASSAVHVRHDFDSCARSASRLLEDLARLPGLGGESANVRSLDPARGTVASGVFAEPSAGFPGLPSATLDAADGYAAAAAALVAPYVGDGLPADAGRAAVLLPLTLADVQARPRPSRSKPRAMGSGAVCADLASSRDEELFARLLDTIDPSQRSEPEHVSAVAQSWRLPVLPYRSRAAADAVRASEADTVAIARVSRICAPRTEPSGFRLVRGAAPFTGLRICDLSTMWAGPLATAMMRSLGASVVKVEMPTRPDGMRRAFAVESNPRRPSAMFATLNAGKRSLRLDLRRERDRASFERLLAESDVLVESFSRRVMPNLGYDEETLRAIRPGLLIAAARAFGPGERAAWIAYGSGIHAASGLADLGRDRFGAACVSYPDPLAGVALFGAIVAQVLSRERTGRASTVEVSLWDALRPLLDLPQAGELELEPTTEQVLKLGHVPALAGEVREWAG